MFLFVAGYVSTALAAVTVGGYIKLDYITRDKPFDYVGVGDSSPTFNGIPCCSSLFAPQDGTANAEDNRTTLLAGNESRLTFLVTDIGAPKGAKGRTFIEFDFINDASGTSQQRPRLRQAYAEMMWPNFEILFGQHYTLFAPIFSETLDFNTGTGTGWAFNRVPQFRMTLVVPMGEGTNFSPATIPVAPWGTRPQIEFAIAAERPGTRFSDAPYATASITYSNGHILGQGISWGSPTPFYIMVAGVIGEGEIGSYTTSPPGHNEEPKYDVEGVSVSTQIPIVGTKDGTRALTLTFLGQFWAGEALGDYFLTGFTNLESQWTGDPTDTNEVEGNGGFAELQFWPSENFAVLATYEYLDLDEIFDKATGMGLANFPEKTEKWFGSLRWVVTPWIWAQFEYQFIKTEYENPSAGLDDNGDVHSIQASIYWFF
jgi:hypothetical protein